MYTHGLSACIANDILQVSSQKNVLIHSMNIKLIKLMCGASVNVHVPYVGLEEDDMDVQVHVMKRIKFIITGERRSMNYYNYYMCSCSI